MFDANEVVFAWAIGKAMLIVMVSIGALIYLAWAVTRKMEIAAQVEVPEDFGSASESAVQARKGPLAAIETTDESAETGQSLVTNLAGRNDRGESEQSAAA